MASGGDNHDSKLDREISAILGNAAKLGYCCKIRMDVAKSGCYMKEGDVGGKMEVSVAKLRCWRQKWCIAAKFGHFRNSPD